MEPNIEEILKNSDLERFLTGDLYPIIDRQNDMPTDTQMVFFHLEKYYKSSHDENLWKCFESAMIDFSKGPENMFLVPIYLMSFFRFKSKHYSITIDLVSISKSFRQGLSVHKEYLNNNPMWVGKNIKGGILSYIHYMLDMIKIEYNVDLNGGHVSNDGVTV